MPDVRRRRQPHQSHLDATVTHTDVSIAVRPRPSSAGAVRLRRSSGACRTAASVVLRARRTHRTCSSSAPSAPRSCRGPSPRRPPLARSHADTWRRHVTLGASPFARGAAVLYARTAGPRRASASRGRSRMPRPHRDPSLTAHFRSCASSPASPRALARSARHAQRCPSASHATPPARRA